MLNETRADAPHGILFAVVVALLFAIPMLLGNSGSEALTEFMSGLLSPLGLLLLPIVLLLVIQFLSSNNFVSGMFSTEPNTIHRASGSPVGVALVLVLVLVLLYAKVSMFGGREDSEK